MKRVAAKSLKVPSKIESDMYHPGGELLLSAGQRLTGEILRSLAGAGIEEVVFFDPGEDRKALVAAPVSEPISISTFTQGQALQEDIYSADGILLFSKGDILTKDILDSLHGRGEGLVYAMRAPDAGRVRRFIETYAKEKIKSLKGKVAQGDIKLAVESGGIPYRRLMLERRSAERGHSDKVGLLRKYSDLCAGLEHIFNGLRNNRAVEKNEVCRIIDSLCEAVLTDREMTVALSSRAADPEDYIVPHSMAAGLLAILTGLFVGYSEEQVKLLATVALLHDIGMLGVSERVIRKSGPLSPREESDIQMHSEIGVGLALRILLDDDTLPLVIYQTHERQSGVGYPENLHEADIHEFAKVTAIADTYSALTGRRSHREGQLPAEAVRSVLKMAKIGILSDKFVAALVEALSLYPLGSWVLLNTRETCRVVGANPGKPDMPKLSVVFDSEGQTVTGYRMVDLIRSPGTFIEMPVEDPLETKEDPLVGF